jgi:hypothetical protein
MIAMVLRDKEVNQLMKRRSFLRAAIAATAGTAAIATHTAHAHDDDLVALQNETPLASNLKELAELGIVFGKVDKKSKADSFVVNSLKADDILPSIIVQFTAATDVRERM